MIIDYFKLWKDLEESKFGDVTYMFAKIQTQLINNSRQF